jgi:hypothetical protein
MQLARSPGEVTAAQEDRKKDVVRFYAALGVDAAHPPDLPRLRELTNHAEADIGPYVRAAKEKFSRLRPYEIEPRLRPCIRSSANTFYKHSSRRRATRRWRRACSGSRGISCTPSSSDSAYPRVLRRSTAGDVELW